MPNTCCGCVVFLAELSVSSRIICWLDPCGIMSAGIGSEIKSFGLAAALPLGAAEERFIPAIRSDRQTVLCSARLKTTQTKLGHWEQTSSQNKEEYGQEDRSRMKMEGYSTNCEVMSECTAQ